MQRDDLPPVKFPTDEAYQWIKFLDLAQTSFIVFTADNREIHNSIDIELVNSPYFDLAYAVRGNSGEYCAIFNRYLSAYEFMATLVPHTCQKHCVTFNPDLEWSRSPATESFDRDGRHFTFCPASARLDDTLIVAVAICRDEELVEVYSMFTDAKQRFEDIREHGFMSVREILEKGVPDLLKEYESLPKLKEIKLDTKNYPWRKDKRPVIKLPLNLLWDVPKDRINTAVICARCSKGFFDSRKLAIMVVQSPYLNSKKAFGVYLDGKWLAVFSHYIGAAGFALEYAKTHNITAPMAFRDKMLWVERELLHEDFSWDRLFTGSFAFRHYLRISILHSEEDDVIAFGLFDDGDLANVFASADEAAEEMKQLMNHYSLRYLGNSSRTSDS